MIPLYVTCGLFILYAILIVNYWIKWKSIPYYNPGPGGNLKVSVVVPARNEEERIGDLLTALQTQTYPADLFEVIVVDDHSTDGTAEKVNQFENARLIRLIDEPLNSYKKKAIETGISAATGELIITTDADCIPGPKWIETLVSFQKEKNSVAIAAPVNMECGPRFIEIFQCMDFMVLQGITGAVVHHHSLTMANGANFAYLKKAFNEVEGFQGIDHIASGDDMLLAHKLSTRFPGRYHYVLSRDAMVTTSALGNMKDFLTQRFRWSGKSGSYQDKRILPILLIVFFYNLSFIMLIAAGFFIELYWWIALISWPVKTILELPFYISISRFFKKTWTIRYFFLLQPFHIAYTIIAGIGGQAGGYSWKGRIVK